MSVFAKSVLLQDSCLVDCKFLLVKIQFCRTVLYVIIVIWEIFAGYLSDRIKYFVSQNKILLVLTDRPALYMKIDTYMYMYLEIHITSYTFRIYNFAS